MNLKEVIAEAKAKAEATAIEKNLDKDSTKKLIAEYIKEAKEKFETENSTKAKPKIKKYQVSTPTDNFNGEVAGVQFAYGKAIVQEGWILNWFKEKGYEVEEVNE